MPSPNDPGGPLNYLIVPAGNSRFRSVGVRSGDILKYFIVEDETIDEERRKAGVATRLAMEFTVAQVVERKHPVNRKGCPAQHREEIHGAGGQRPKGAQRR